MRFRIFNRIYATLFGYFWLPCPICKKPFGGHEWHGYKPSGLNGMGICRDCSGAVRKMLIEAGEAGLYCVDCEKILTAGSFNNDAPTCTQREGNLVIKGRICKRCQERLGPQ